MALAATVSWYPRLDLSLLEAVRASSDSDVHSAWGSIRHHATEKSTWINPLEYIPLVDEEGEEEAATTMSELKSSIYSYDYCHSNPARPSEGICSSSSNAYHDSDLASDSSSSSAQRLEPDATKELEPTGPQPDASTSQAHPSTPQPEPDAAQPDRAAAQPNSTAPPSGGEAASDAPAA